MRKLDVKLSRVEYSRLRPVVIALLDHEHERSVWENRISRCKTGRASMDPLDYVVHRAGGTHVHYLRELAEWASKLPESSRLPLLEGLYLLVWKSLESGMPGAGISGTFDVGSSTLEIQSKEQAMTAAYGGPARNSFVQARALDSIKDAAHALRYGMGPGQIQQLTSDHFEIIPPEEATMSTALEAVKIEEVTRVNGRDVADISDGDLLTLIRGEKAKIENLQEMKLGSKRIVGILDDLKASVAELTAIFDSRA